MYEAQAEEQAAAEEVGGGSRLTEALFAVLVFRQSKEIGWAGGRSAQ